MFLVLLLAACTPLEGEWSGAVDCGTYDGDVELALVWSDGAYEGDGTLDCTEALGSECEQAFEIEVRPERTFGEQPLDVDLDDCSASGGGMTIDYACDSPDEVTWDGADTIEGEWDDCEFELTRAS